MEGRGKKKDKKIDLNIPHIIKALKKKKSRDTRFMYVVDIFVV